ncbi:sialate O-acetylesterase [Flavobacterium faecale]|uniref:Sialate O-acetylesterase n=1 Tax=Flavobacterium faecale TaxID=1355330 RepID=A0A2S1LG78_9FLAO|nr:sialate O-acetylesterase [Flavobacterium faecale]AWG22661.1 sialate O-acetylesterase [Flavobacterium faecale]
MKPLLNSISVLLLLLSFGTVKAEVKLPSIFSNHMVLQRNQQNPIWGKASAGEKVTVVINGQKHKTSTDESGNWKVKLAPMQAGGPYVLTVQGKNKITFKDVLIGEVWVCAGQSNMQWSVVNSNHSEVELAAANYPNIRLFSVPLVATPELQTTIADTTWYACTPKSIPEFSAPGYFFGIKLYQALGIPIGLINASWGSSSLETWVPRDAMEKTNDYSELLEDWDLAVKEFTDEKLVEVTKKYEAWEAAGKPGKKMPPPRDIRIGQNRPANAFNGVINPILGYGIKGTIWCQGESNVGRSFQTRTLFPLLINSWRERWGQGDFPFYWIQLADFGEAKEQPSESNWAEHREAQTQSLSIPKTGEVVTFDLGEERDIHYRDKQTVGNRLVRHALANEYGYKMEASSPRYLSMEKKQGAIIITFDHIDKGLYAFDNEVVKGFAIAGEDQKFEWATAKIISKNQIEVAAGNIKNPVAVRYGWANNPEINLYDFNGLPVTSFRTDDWKVSTQNAKKASRRY